MPVSQIMELLADLDENVLRKPSTARQVAALFDIPHIPEFLEVALVRLVIAAVRLGLQRAADSIHTQRED